MLLFYECLIGYILMQVRSKGSNAFYFIVLVVHHTALNRRQRTQICLRPSFLKSDARRRQTGQQSFVDP